MQGCLEEVINIPIMACAAAHVAYCCAIHVGGAHVPSSPICLSKKKTSKRRKDIGLEVWIADLSGGGCMPRSLDLRGGRMYAWIIVWYCAKAS